MLSSGAQVKTDASGLPVFPGIVTYLDYVNLAFVAYQDEKPLHLLENRWERLVQSSQVEALRPRWPNWLEPSKRDFYAAAYVSRDLKAIVITVRGTQLPKLGHLIDDFWYIAWGYCPPSIHNLITFYDHVRVVAAREGYADYTFSVTGHSLGGLLSEVLAYIKNLSAVTFDSPGSENALYNHLKSTLTYQGDRMRIYNYLSNPNKINESNPQLGKIINIEVNLRQNQIEQMYALGLLVATTAVAEVSTFGCAGIVTAYYGANLLADTLRYHNLVNFKKSVRDLKFYLFAKWPPPPPQISYGSFFDKAMSVVPNHTRSKDALNVYSMPLESLFFDRNMQISKSSAWTIDECLIIIVKPSLILETVEKEAGKIKRDILSKLHEMIAIDANSFKSVNEDFTVFELEQALINFMVSLPASVREDYIKKKSQGDLSAVPAPAVPPAQTTTHGARAASSANYAKKPEVKAALDYNVHISMGSHKTQSLCCLHVVPRRQIIISSYVMPHPIRASHVRLWDASKPGMPIEMRKWDFPMGTQQQSAKAVAVSPKGDFFLVDFRGQYEIYRVANQQGIAVTLRHRFGGTAPVLSDNFIICADVWGGDQCYISIYSIVDGGLLRPAFLVPRKNSRDLRLELVNSETILISGGLFHIESSAQLTKLAEDHPLVTSRLSIVNPSDEREATTFFNPYVPNRIGKANTLGVVIFDAITGAQLAAISPPNRSGEPWGRCTQILSERYVLIDQKGRSIPSVWDYQTNSKLYDLQLTHCTPALRALVLPCGDIMTFSPQENLLHTFDRLPA